MNRLLYENLGILNSNFLNSILKVIHLKKFFKKLTPNLRQFSVANLPQQQVNIKIAFDGINVKD